MTGTGPWRILVPQLFGMLHISCSFKKYGNETWRVDSHVWISYWMPTLRYWLNGLHFCNSPPMEYTDNSSFLKLLNPLLGICLCQLAIKVMQQINIFTPGAEIDIYVRWLISTMLKYIIGFSKHVWSFWICFKLFECQGNYVWSE